MEGKLNKIKGERSIAWERLTWFEEYGFINDSRWEAPQLIKSS